MNRRSIDYESIALPTEPHQQITIAIITQKYIFVKHFDTFFTIVSQNETLIDNPLFGVVKLLKISNFGGTYEKGYFAYAGFTYSCVFGLR